MFRTHRRGFLTINAVVACALFVGVLSSPIVVSQSGEIAGALQRTWQRTDGPIAAGVTSRSWLWGPAPISPIQQEPYIDAPGGTRVVQYFDKSRMEVTDPGADQASAWYVTNGLLVVELVSGQLQLGDDAFESRGAARVNIAGDLDIAGITYAHLAGLLVAPAWDAGQIIRTLIKLNPPHEPIGVIQLDDEALARYGVMAGPLVPETNHRVASVFWEFMTSSGTIAQDGQYVVGPLFPDPYYATGFPITEAYWMSAKVGGVYRDVLVQCFQRRCLTYTPDNPVGWQVEAGNVGQHYATWRYSTANPIAFTSDHDVYTIHPDGTGLENRTNHPSYDWGPAWSPDGIRLLFMSDRDVTPNMPISDVCCSGELYVAEPGHRDPLRLTTFLPDLIERWTWSPDGREIAVAVSRGDHVEIWIVNGAGSGSSRMLTGSGYQPAWSPDGSLIAFVSDRDGNPELFVIDVSDGTETQLTFTSEVIGASGPRWSPDGARIAFQTNRDDDYEIYVMNLDGSDQTNLTQASSYDEHHSWSPDGANLAFASERDGQIGIYAVSVEDRMTIDLTPNTTGDTAPAWSPDGRRIAFVSWRDSVAEIYVMNADGSNQVRLTRTDTEEGAPEW